MRKHFWLGNWGMRAIACGIFIVLVCGPGRMVSQAVAKPGPIVQVGALIGDGGTVF